MRDVVIVGAARTAIGSFLGSLASVQAPRLGATAIKSALERAGVAGGMESMSNAPHVVRGLRNGVKMGALDTADSMITDGLWDPYSNQHMGNCAELCAKDMKISRGAQDEFAAESYKRALAAVQSGAFKAEIAA